METLPGRDIAIITVLCAVGFLLLLTYTTYRCNPSLFKRQHRARPGITRSVSQVDSQRIDPVKLSKMVSNASLRSYATTITTQSSLKSAKSSTLTTTQEVPVDVV